MDDRQFDGIARAIAAARSRRQLLKSLIGFGAVAASVAAVQESEAARRGYGGPPKTVIGCQPQCDGNFCGPNGCGGTCACRFGCFCLAGAANEYPNASATCVVEFIVPQGSSCHSTSDCATYGPNHVCDVPSGICFVPCQS